MVTLCFPTLRRFDTLQQAADSAMAGDMRPDKIVVIDNSLGKCPPIRGAEVIVPKKNLGIAGAWNYFMTNYDDHVIISNDDVILHSDTISKLVAAMEEKPEEMFFYMFCNAEHDNSFSFFSLRKKLYEIVGPFDTDFFPAYFEDNDYHYRMRLKGYDMYRVPNVTYTHIGSATVRSFNQYELNDHHRSFNNNMMYYMSKWGGKPHEEKFTKPFDLDES